MHFHSTPSLQLLLVGAVGSGLGAVEDEERHAIAHGDMPENELQVQSRVG